MQSLLACRRILDSSESARKIPARPESAKAPVLTSSGIEVTRRDIRRRDPSAARHHLDAGAAPSHNAAVRMAGAPAFSEEISPCCEF